MMIDSQKLKTTPAGKVLLAVTALLAVLTLYQVAEFSLAGTRAELTVARATEAAAEPNESEAPVAQAKSAAEALKQKNLFAPPPPLQNPVREVLGILGSEALINDKWYKAGDSVGDAKILAVEPTKIRVSWNGQETEFAPLGSGGGGGPEGGPGPEPTGQPSGPPQGAGSGSGRVRPPRPQGPAGAEQAALREQFRNASPEEREKLREMMRERSAAPRR